MKSKLLEAGFFALTLVAALVSVTVVGAESSERPAAYAGGYPGGPSGPYPGAAHPPVWGVLVAPTQFPWWHMPTLPDEARWDRPAPVFFPPNPSAENLGTGDDTVVTESELKGQGHGR